MKRFTPVLLCVAACGLARADVAFDNFGPGTTFTGNGWLVYGPQGGGLWWTHAFPVTPTLSGEITTVTLALQYFQGSPNNFVIDLRADAAGTPGAVLGSLGAVAGFSSRVIGAASDKGSPGRETGRLRRPADALDHERPHIAPASL